MRAANKVFGSGLLLVLLSGHAWVNGDPSVIRITVHDDNAIATIYGTNFVDEKEEQKLGAGNAPPVVRIGWGTDPDLAPLEVMEYGNEMIVVALPNDLGEGDYRVSVAHHYDGASNGGSSEEKRAAQWDLTVGAVDPAADLFAIGDIGPAGGIVFHVTDGGLHGLEAAPADIPVLDIPWGCWGTAISGADVTSIGGGAQNTGDIVTWCMEPGIAARHADHYTLNGYSDWYLPSKDALDLMYWNIGQGSNNVGGFAPKIYWSSSEYSEYNAWLQHFGDNGAQGFNSKRETPARKVRVVRTF